MRPARITIVLALVALLLLLPTTALAQEAGEPEMMDDPIEAMEPEIELTAPAEPADDGAPAGEPMPEAGGIADAGIARNSSVIETGAAYAAPGPVTSGSGQLPFTGLDSGQLMQLFLVGSVLLAGGATALAWAGARAETA